MTIQRYRLTIGTARSGTHVVIGATRDDEAMTKAERIVASLSEPEATFRLQRANGSVLSVRSPATRSD